MRKLVQLTTPLALLALAGCEVVGDTSGFAVESVTSTFFVENAEPGEPLSHEFLRGRIASGMGPAGTRDFAYLPHRIEEGSGTVFAYRTFSSDKNIGTGYGLKLTLFLNQPLPTTPTEIRLGGSDPSGNIAFIADWSHGSGCLAYASSGVVRVDKIQTDGIAAHLRLEFNWIPVHDSQMSCVNHKIFEEDLVFEKRQFKTLSPWEGRSNESVARGSETWPLD